MRATLKKIHPLKMSTNGNLSFIRLDFVLENGKFAMTDIVPKFKNFTRWRAVINAGIGTEIDGVKLINDNKINADSNISLVIKR